MIQPISALPDVDDIQTRGLEPISVLQNFSGFDATIMAQVSQMGVGVWNACGIAIALSLLRDCGLALSATVTYWSRIIDALQDGTTVSNLKDMITQLGGHAESGSATPSPYAMLTRYNRLPAEHQNPTYAGQTFLHWIGVEEGPDFDYYVDPLQPTGKGGPFKVAKGSLSAIDVDPAQRVGLTDTRILSTLPVHDGKPFDIDIDSLSWRVRKSPTPTAETLGVVTQGQRVHVLGRAVINNIEYEAVQRSAGGADLSVLNEATLDTEGESVAWLKKGSGWSVVGTPEVPPPIVVTYPHRLGVNTINDGRAAQDALSKGAPSILICDGAQFAFDLATQNPWLTVIHRKVGIPKIANVAQMLQALEFNTSARYPSNLRILGFNEADSWGQSLLPGQAKAAHYRTSMSAWANNVQPYIDLSNAIKNGVDWDAPHARAMGQNPKRAMAQVTELVQRLRVDREVNKIVRGQGAMYGSGSWSMGTPTLESPDIQHVFQDEASEAYNKEGIWYDFHSYSPRVNFHEIDPIYFAGRPKAWLFSHCGFDPKIRHLSCSETGVDEGGVGGFVAHNSTEAQFLKWCKDYTDYMALPVIVNGVSYPSPVQDSQFFQWGQNTSWANYDVRGFSEALVKSYWGNRWH